MLPHRKPNEYNVVKMEPINGFRWLSVSFSIFTRLQRNKCLAFRSSLCFVLASDFLRFWAFAFLRLVLDQLGFLLWAFVLVAFLSLASTCLLRACQHKKN